jgi:hypothetical protein
VLSHQATAFLKERQIVAQRHGFCFFRHCVESTRGGHMVAFLVAV